MITFIGLSFGVVDNKLCAIATSAGYSIADLEGISTRTALHFLWSLAYLNEYKQTPKPALVMFDAAVDLELLLQSLSSAKKDIIFGLYKAKEDRYCSDLPIYDQTTPEYRGIVETMGFTLSQLPGKVLRLKRGRRSALALYDVSAYFNATDINEAAQKFLGASRLETIEKNLLPLWKDGLEGQLIDRCEQEARLIVRLADKVYQTVAPLEIVPNQWYGPSTIATKCLTKWQARRQAKRLNPKNSPGELLKAIDCAYFGGRVEAIKLGTIEDVRTFDLNSAYAYATTLLSQFYKPLRFTRKYYDIESSPFSCWLVEYELPEDIKLGILPTRAPTGGISFRRRGAGYFWQPEVDYLVKAFPDKFNIRWGYIGPEYNPVTFAGHIKEMYEYRSGLKAQGDAGEKIIKLALANLYGKFAQNTGTAHFQCRSWAGWITSFVRRLLLDAVQGLEDSVICFCQDAVHLQGTEARQLIIGDGLGEWKRGSYASGLYVSPGIYDLREQGQSVKQAMRGSNLGLDFEQITRDLSERQATVLERTFFVGWQLSRQVGLKWADSYLQEVHEALDLIPSKLKARNYLSQFDWGSEHRDSVISNAFNGQLSSRYIPSDSLHPAALRLRLRDRGIH